MTNKQLAHLASNVLTVLLLLSWWKFGIAHPVSVVFAVIGLPCQIINLLYFFKVLQ